MNFFATPIDTAGCEFWHGAERQGWLQKQGGQTNVMLVRKAAASAISELLV